MVGFADHDDTRRTTGTWLLVLYFGLLGFGLGASLLESFLIDPMWRDLGTRMSNDDFLLIRRQHTWRIFPLLVVPLAIRVPVTVELLWRKPEFVPVGAVLGALAAQLVGWASSLLIQIPIQFALTEAGFSDALFARLIATDFWFRVLPLAVEVAVAMTVLQRLVAELSAPLTIGFETGPRSTAGGAFLPVGLIPTPPLLRRPYQGD